MLLQSSSRRVLSADLDLNEALIVIGKRKLHLSSLNGYPSQLLIFKNYDGKPCQFFCSFAHL